MLSELFVTATLSSAKTAPAGSRDASLAIRTLHPSPAIKTAFKKNSSLQNCIAVSGTHIYAAQSEKAVVHVYSRERENQEVSVPFPERIHSLTIAAPEAGGVLILGTEGGRVILWEICTGRQISTSQSHLQATTTLAVDPSSNFVLSGSADSNIHLWSLPLLLSFSNPESTTGLKPLRSFTQHRAAISCACFGHGSGRGSISVSASRDGSCIVWDVQSGSPLRTFLLTSSPISLAVDPCDRAFYVGLEDGSIQLADLFKSFASSQEPLRKRVSNRESEHPGTLLPSSPLYIPQLQTAPTTLSPKTERWVSSGQELGPVLCLDILFEGNYVLSGHQSGKVIMWDAAKGRVWKEIIDLQAPVTNLIVLPPTGFPATDGKSNSKVKVHTVTKPRYEPSFTSPTGVPSDAVPANYVFAAKFSDMLETPRVSATQPRSARARDEQSMLASCIDSTSFPPSILSAGIAELAHWPGQGTLSLTESEDRGNIADRGNDAGDASDLRSIEHLRQSNRELWTMVNSMRNIQKNTWEIVNRLRAGQRGTKAVKRRGHRSNGSELSEDGIEEGSEKESVGESEEGAKERDKDTHMGNAD
ncbi:MAG: Pre-rRNA-processing protein ipi3 [Geoglossum simile]|nr:MAG: Pre-rRNA-processing protein ipi3 [Geoglossum simile]